MLDTLASEGRRVGMQESPVEDVQGKAPIRVILADDEIVIREALQDLLADEPELEVVGTAGDADEAIRVAHDLQPDVALVDMKMPGGGPAAAAGIRRVSPGSSVLALTAYYDLHSVLDMLRSGACGYLIKGDSPGRIAQNIVWAVSGQAIIPRTVMREVITALFEQLDRAEGLAEQVRALDRKKSELVQVLSHELRTPVTILQGTALTLARRIDTLSEEDRAEFLMSIQRAARRIGRTASHVSESALLTQEDVQLATAPVKLKDLINGALSEFPPDQAKRVVWSVGHEHAVVKVWADRIAATRCLVQVLENALDFSPPEDLVEIEVDVLPEDVEITVVDSGPGVPEEMKETVFGLFTQADSTSKRSHEGVGVGLYLARQLMEAQDGSVRVGSGHGAGSRFILAFARFKVPVWRPRGP